MKWMHPANTQAIDAANELYLPLCDCAQRIMALLRNAGYEVSHGFFSNHSIRAGERWIVENYPIPVLSIAGVGDIGVDMGFLFIELHMPRERACLMDVAALTDYGYLEVYGLEQYETDLYHPGMDVETTAQRIAACSDPVIGVTFYFEHSVSDETLLAVVGHTLPGFERRK